MIRFQDQTTDWPAFAMLFAPTIATNYWVDVYVLTQERTAATINRFKAGYLSQFTESRDRYEHPLDRNSEPAFDLSQLLHLLYLDTALEYALYWNAPKNGNTLAGMMFFTEDGGLIVGLTVKDHLAESTLRQLRDEFSAQHGGITLEAPPPLSAALFRERYPLLKQLPSIKRRTKT